MDVSLTIVTIVYIVILVVPGVFFKRFYFQGDFNRQFQSGQFADRFVTSIFWGIVTQLLFFYAFINSFNVEFDSIFGLLSETHKVISENRMPNLGKGIFTNLLLYLLGSVLFAVALGFISFKFVRLTQLDLRTNVLRFSNKWYYYFSGEILKTKEFKSRIPKNNTVIGTLVDVLIKYGEGDDRLFSGNLVQYTINSDGNLETLFLAGTRRYSDSRGEKIPPKEVPGDCFVIPYQNVLNMNIQYIFVQKEIGIKRELAKKGVSFIGQLLIFACLISLMVFPWYGSASIPMKLLAIILFLFSWLFMVIFISNLTGPKLKFGLKGSLFLFSLFLLLGFSGFESLGFGWFKIFVNNFLSIFY